MLDDGGGQVELKAERSAVAARIGRALKRAVSVADDCAGVAHGRGEVLEHLDVVASLAHRADQRGIGFRDRLFGIRRRFLFL